MEYYAINHTGAAVCSEDAKRVMDTAIEMVIGHYVKDLGRKPFMEEVRHAFTAVWHKSVEAHGLVYAFPPAEEVENDGPSNAGN